MKPRVPPLPKPSKELLAFKKMADDFVKKATVSGKTANETLASLGIYTIKGKLTKNYRD